MARPEERAGKRWNQEHAARAIRSVENQHGIRDLAVRIALRRADRRVMQPNFGKRLAVREFKIAGNEIAFLWRNA